MKNLGRALKAGVKGFVKAFEPTRYQAGGLQIRCTHCKGELFQEKEAYLNTSGGSLLNLDLLDRFGTALICDECGLIQWYAKKPEKLQP